MNRTFLGGLRAALGATLLASGPVAFAQDTAAEPDPPFTVSGTAAFVTDYRFRGVSQSDNSVAVQGGLTLSHESGFYAGFWASSLAGWGTFGGPNVELDIFGGYKFDLGPAAIDAGLTAYTYPGGADTTTFVELYVKASGSLGPVGVTGGIFYAPSQEALGNWFAHPDSEEGDKEDNIYISGDFTYGIEGTPITAKAHIGYSNGNPGLGPNGTSVAPTGSYVDWLIGADVALGPVVLGFAYVDTNISDTSDDWLRLQPNFSEVSNGKAISNAKFVFSITGVF
jgi:uncharacterized protein (TIGR02001 family)